MAHSASSIISLSDTDLIEQSTLTSVKAGQRVSSCSLTCVFLFFSRSRNQKNPTSSEKREKKTSSASIFINFG